MANVLVNEKTLKVIADAVRARGGTSALMKPGEIPDAVSKIPSGGSGADMSLPVRFFDYEGTLLYSFSLEELARLECLPDLVVSRRSGLYGLELDAGEFEKDKQGDECVCPVCHG